MTVVSVNRVRNRRRRCTIVALFYLFILPGRLDGQRVRAGQAEVIRGCMPLVTSDATPFNPPGNEDYPVAGSFNGHPAPIQLGRDPRIRRFLKRLREGAILGPNFSGHFTIVGWGCGASCLQFAIVDAESGRVEFPDPIRNVTTTHVGADAAEEGVKFNGLRFQLQSSLLVIIGSINEKDSSEGIHYYKWSGTHLVHVRTIRSRKLPCKVR
jgi:hypothetical protein